MRIATWNVNSLRARLDKVVGWLGTAEPDVLLMQETKLADEAAPDMAFGMAGYRWPITAKGAGTGSRSPRGSAWTRSSPTSVMGRCGRPAPTRRTTSPRPRHA